MFAPMFLNLGIQLVQQGKLSEAEAAFRQAIAADEQYEQAYTNLGLILYRQGRFMEAEACLIKAINLQATPSAYNNLALVYMDTNRSDKAEACLRRGLKIRKDLPELYNNLGLVLEDDTLRQGEAEQAYRKAIKLNPNYAEAYYNIGNLFKKMHRLPQAEKAYFSALKLYPHYKEALFALSSLYLLLGQFKKGWRGYNAFRMAQSTKRNGPIPLWQGEELAGKNILLFYEQGFGDTLQFVRYALLVKDRAAHTVLWVQKSLEILCSTSFPEIQVYTGEQPPEKDFDLACALPDLPMLFNTTLQDIPYQVPYIFSCQAITEKWRNLLYSLAAMPTYKVGVVWQGNPRHHNDANRSIPFSQFRQLFSFQQAAWVSLQVEATQGEVLEAEGSLLQYNEMLTDFAQTAGLLAQLDLVITVDSAVAHLAGAMGKKTWLLLPFLPDWRWQLERKDSVWYPSLRLFRQPSAGDWQSVLVTVQQELLQMVQPK